MKNANLFNLIGWINDDLETMNFTKVVPVPSLIIYIILGMEYLIQKPISIKINEQNAAPINLQVYLQIFIQALQRHTQQTTLIGKIKILTIQLIHSTNLIFIQNCSDDQQFSQNVHVEPNYYFLRKENKSFKADESTLPNLKKTNTKAHGIHH